MPHRYPIFMPWNVHFKSRNNMIVYYKLFDLLNRKGMKKSDLYAVISSKTVAKLSKNENLDSRVIVKICKFLDCQPGDIMEVVRDDTKGVKQ